VCPGRGSISPSVTCCRAMQPVWRHYRLAAGPERGGYVCHVDPRHGQDHRCGGETLYTSNECSSEVEQSKCRAPHPLLQLVGCMGIRCVVYGSEPPSHPRGKPSSMLGQRYSTLWRCLTARLLHAVFCYLAGVSQFRGQVSEKGVLEHWGLCLIPRACGCALSARRVVDLECSACRTEHAGIPLC
jgi:hypothetical protein